MDIQTLSILKRTIQYLNTQQQQAYLVGGSLRNILLGEPCSDWDIVIEGDAHKLARHLADTLGGYYAHLHEKASRVIVKQDPSDIILDISPLNGRTIEEDLLRRDFTINAIAATLDEVVQYIEVDTDQSRGRQPQAFPLHLIDPLQGLQDLQAHRLRAVDETIFQHDPLRMLRAVRLRMRYHLNIDPHTQELIKRDAPLLPTVAAERIHDELYAILEPGGATARLRFLDELGLLTVLIPEFAPARGMRQPNPHYWDVLQHSLETVTALEQIAHTLEIISPNNGTISISENIMQIQNILYEAEQQGIFSFAALTAPRMKMAALLHDIGKPPTYTLGEDGAVHFYNHPQVAVPLVQQIMRRLSASTQDRRLAQLVAAHHMRPGQLGQEATVTPRAIRRYFVDLGPTGILVALFSLADHLATLGPRPLQPPGDAWERHLSVVRLLLTCYIRERESVLPPRLLSPEELMRRLKLEPGPIVGQLLEAIAEAQAEGTIHSKEEALWFAEEHLGRL